MREAPLAMLGFCQGEKFINCVAYEGGKKLADIQPSEIHSYVCQPECFVWVALFDPTREELAAMHKEFDLPDLTVEHALNAITGRRQC